MEANQTLHSVWPLPGLVDYIYTFGGSCSVTKFCHMQNSLCILQVLRLRSPIGSVTAGQSSSGLEPNFAALSTWAPLYSAGEAVAVVPTIAIPTTVIPTTGQWA